MCRSCQRKCLHAKSESRIILLFSVLSLFDDFHLRLCHSVLGGVCAVSLFIPAAGLFLHTAPQFVAERRQSRTRSRWAPSPRHFRTAGECDAPHPDLPTCRGKPAPDPLHRFLHMPSAQASGVWSQLHAAGDIEISPNKRNLKSNQFLGIFFLTMVLLCSLSRVLCCVVPALWFGITL